MRAVVRIPRHGQRQTGERHTRLEQYAGKRGVLDRTPTGGDQTLGPLGLWRVERKLPAAPRDAVETVTCQVAPRRVFGPSIPELVPER